MNLDDTTAIAALDKQSQLGSIALLGKQFQHGWNDIHELKIPEGFNNAKNLVFCGMGGSSLGAYVARYLYGLTIGVPFEIINDYHIPSYVNKDSLVVVQSYSGNTEEALSCYKEAQKNAAMLFTISAGGKLEKHAASNGNPHYLINPEFNPCDQPRMGIGYSIVGFLAFLHRLDFISISAEELAEISDVTEEVNMQYNVKLPTSENPAKQTAELFFDKTPYYLAGEFLQGAMHAMRNQINENAKTYAGEHPVPEMNHHLLEALDFPESTKKNDVFVFLDSDLYSDRIKERNTICKKIIEDAGHHVTSIQARGDYKLSHVFSCIQIGAYIGFYLAMKEGIDPSPIPYVEDLKVTLS